MARSLGTRAEVLVLDEPTRGVDVGVESRMSMVRCNARSDGVTILIASTDVPELVALCDRVLVMRDGVVAATLEGEHAHRAQCRCRGHRAAASESTGGPV